MGATVGLLKNIVIDLFVILLACMNLTHLYSILFLNGRQLSASSGIFTIFAMASLSSTGFPTWSLLPSLNLINLNPLWVNLILDLDREVVLYTVSYTTLATISAFSPPTASILPTIFVGLSSLSEYVSCIYPSICFVNGTVALVLGITRT